MTQAATITQEHTAQEGRFEGIGPYAREQFRLASAPRTLSPANPTPAAPTRTAPPPPIATPEIETLDQRAYVSTRWCDVGISLIILGSSAAALFRLVCLGQP